MKLKFIIAHSLYVHALHQCLSWSNFFKKIAMMALVGVIRMPTKSTKRKKKVIQTIQHVKKTKRYSKIFEEAKCGLLVKGHSFKQNF
jgi:hypothetical protein